MGKFIQIRPLGIGATETFRRAWRKYGVAITAIIALGIWTAAVNGIATYRANKAASEQYRAYWEAYYSQQLADYKAEQESERTATLISEANKERAEAIARVLYGVKGNGENDLRTYAWCIFNRVDNRAYPNTLEDVIAQPGQWMAYSADNAVLESLYKIAEEELTAWQTGHRPVSSDFVYMNWTPAQITLRDNWKDGSATNYWRYGK